MGSIFRRLRVGACSLLCGALAWLAPAGATQNADSVRISGTVWIDENLDGLREAEEPVVAGGSVVFAVNGNYLQDVQTDLHGFYTVEFRRDRDYFTANRRSHFRQDVMVSPIVYHATGHVGAPRGQDVTHRGCASLQVRVSDTMRTADVRLRPVRSDRPGSTPAEPADWPLANGHFFTQTTRFGGACDEGFAVTDVDGVPFWSTWLAAGRETMGYPLSDRYDQHDGVTQLFEHGALFWDAGTNQVSLLNHEEMLDLQAAAPPLVLIPQSLPIAPVPSAALARLPSRQPVWEQVAREGWVVSSITADPLTAGRVYALGAGGRGSTLDFLVSQDGGTTWLTQRPGLTSAFATGTAVGTEGTLYVWDLLGGMYRSQDQGGTWAQVSREPRSGEPRQSEALAVDPLDDRVVYVAGGGAFASDFAFARSLDRGEQWEYLDLPVPCVTSTVAVDPRRSGVVYLAGSCGVLQSEDAGRSWTSRWDAPVSGVTVVPSAPNILYAWSADTMLGGLWRSTDVGVSWEPVNSEIRIRGLAVDPRISTGDALVAEWGFGAAWSHDGGVNWISLPEPPPGLNRVHPPLRDMTLVGNGVLVGTHGRGIWRIALPEVPERSEGTP
jgi:hypothetical protein